MHRINTNLYHVDDLLIKVGTAFGLIALFGGSAIVQKSAHSASVFLPYLMLPLLILAPVILLSVGFSIRRREKRIVSVYRLVCENGEVPVSDLIKATGVKRSQLKKAIELLNRKSVAGLVWDEQRNCVRLISLGTRKTLTHGERCNSCGASVNIEISTLSRSEALACPYCSGALNGREISKLQNELHLQNGRQLHQQAPLAFSSRPKPHGKPFSWLLFGFLMMIFWPAGVIYAIKYARSARHLEDLLKWGGE